MKILLGMIVTAGWGFASAVGIVASIVGSIAASIALGSALGTVIPVVGTVVGGAIGLAFGVWVAYKIWTGFNNKWAENAKSNALSFQDIGNNLEAARYYTAAGDLFSDRQIAIEMYEMAANLYQKLDSKEQEADVCAKAAKLCIKIGNKERAKANYQRAASAVDITNRILAEEYRILMQRIEQRADANAETPLQAAQS